MRHKLSEKIIAITCISPSGELLKLKYQLYDHCLRDRWIALMKNGMEKRHVENEGHFFGKRFSNEKELEELINQSIKIINDFSIKYNFSKAFIPLVAKIPMSTEFLNEAHEYFEKLDQYKKLKMLPDVKLAIMNLNIAIHKAEQFTPLGKYSCDHLQILMVPQVSRELQEEDYKLFEKDLLFGELYLTYGVTGVPTKDAFIHKTDFTPQNVYTSGMMLCFLEDLIFQFDVELDQWLREKGEDPKDPRLAIGSIPLGKIIEPAIGDHEEFLNKLANFQKIIDVEFEEKLPEARWPYDSEIFYHLDFRPYLNLEIKFDTTEMLREANKALAYFVVHRDYDQVSDRGNGKWMALGLRALFGDYTKTQYHNGYEYNGEPIYQNTSFLDLCPHTKEFLNQITDLDLCERVRFMLLEPGAKIKVHRDNHLHDTSLAINISLNMPSDCEFWADLNSDGSKNKYSLQVPFQDSGSVVLFNNAKFHSVENNSNVARIHIILHGPIRFSDNFLINSFRTQNSTTTNKEIIQKLVAKKAFLGESLKKTPALYADWVNSGLLPDACPSEIEICIWDHEKYANDELRAKALRHVTIPSIFPLKHKIINESDIDKEIINGIKVGKSHLILVASGTLFVNLHLHLFNLISFCQKMTKDQTVIAGQIMDYPIEGQIPYLHEQYIIINLAEWEKNVTELLGPLFTNEFLTFTSYKRSNELFHDNYTPFWIAAGDQMAPRSGYAKWGTKVMNELLLKNKAIINLPAEIRETKTYSYPRDIESKGWIDVQRRIENLLKDSKEKVFVFNNEVLTIAPLNIVNPNTLITVAAGFKPFKVLDQYKMGENTKIHFIDFSQHSLDYEKEMASINNISEVISLAARYGNLDEKMAYHHVNSIVRDYFNGSQEGMLSAIKSCANATFDNVDLIRDSQFMANILNSESRFIIWISNVFYNNQLYYFISKDAAHALFIKNALEIAKKLKTKAFLFSNTNTIVFGSSITEPIGIMTDGAAQELSLESQMWEKL